MRRFAIVLVLLAAFGITSPARAAWAPDGNPVARLPADEYGIAAIPFGAGGVLVAWLEEGAESVTRRVRVSALTAEGDPVPGWPDGGLSLASPSALPMSLAMAADGEGGAYVSWEEGGVPFRPVHLQRVTGDGVVASGWPDGGLVVGPDAVGYGAHPPASDGAGGAYIHWIRNEGPSVWSVRLTRITGAGTRASGWPDEGVEVGTGHVGTLTPDGAGGVFVGGVEWSLSGPRLWVQRMQADGAVHQDWSADGVRVSEEAPNYLELVPDEAGGVFATWVRGVACIPEEYCPIPRSAARLDGSGGRPAGWPDGGLQLGDAGPVARDGAGGLISAWTYYSARVTRVGRDAVREPGWASGGNSACTETGAQSFPAVVSDGTGGAFVMWSDARIGAPALYQSRLTSTGTLAPGWPATGSLAAPAAVEPSELLLVATGSGAIGVWVDRREGSRDVYAEAVRPGIAGPPAPQPPRIEFGIDQLWPNPSRGPVQVVLSLPDPGVATLDLIDVAGRVVQTLDVPADPPLLRPVQIGGSVRSPGVYWVSLRQGTRRASAKVLIVP